MSDDAKDDLEQAINRIGYIAELIHLLSDGHDGLRYLADRLQEHRDDALNAFRRIFKSAQSEKPVAP